MFIISKYTSPYFFRYFSKSTKLSGILPNSTLSVYLLPPKEQLSTGRRRPIIIAPQTLQSKQNSNYEFLAVTEEVNIIKALELLWPLLRTKTVIRMLAKLLVTSNTINTNFPQGFFLTPIPRMY